MQYWTEIRQWLIKTLTETSELERDTPSNLRMLNVITMVVYIAAILMIIFTVIQGLLVQASILGALWLLLTGSGALLLRGQTFPARFLSPLAILIATSIIAARANGLHDSTIALFPVIIIFASLTLGARGALIFAILVSLTTISMGTLEISGVLINRFSDLTDLTDLILIGVLAPGITAAIQTTLLTRLSQSIIVAQKTSSEQKQINEELLRLQLNLENIIKERTQELESKSGELGQQLGYNQRRARQF